ncbi:hypothetical protein ACS386_02710 [Flavobacteriaceae bacterium LMO-SS05]
MKLKLTSIIFFGIFIQIFATQGILMFNIFNLLGVWEIKKVLYPIGLVLVLIPFMMKSFSLKKITLSQESVLLFSYLIIQYFVLVFNKIPLLSFLYSFREVVVLFLVIVVYQRFNLKKQYFETISKWLLYLVVANIIFVIINFSLGPESYMRLMTGRYYWPIDPLLKFKISTFYSGFYRSPGLIGESASVGFFGVFAFFIIVHSKLKRFFWIPLILIFLSFTRSAYLVVIIYFLLQVLSNKKYLKFTITITPIIIAFVIYLFYARLLSLESLWMRIDNWINVVDLNSNFIFGGNLANIGSSASDESSFASIMDSYWLYLYHGLGLLGICLVLYFLFKKIAYTKDNLFILIGLIVAGLFVTYTQSIPFLVFFPLLAIKNWWEKQKTYNDD